MIFKNELKEFNKKYNEPYGDSRNDGKYNTILSKNYVLGLDSEKTFHDNIIVYGGNKYEQEENFIIPNLLKANGSYVVIDRYNLYEKCKDFFRKEGYKIKVFNPEHQDQSCFYNPIKYCQDRDISSFVDCILQGRHNIDPFNYAANVLLTALIRLVKTYPEEKQTFRTVLSLLRQVESDENNPNAKSPLDEFFDNVQKNNPDSFALADYKSFKMGTYQQRKSIILELEELIERIEYITEKDDVELETIGDEKTILFIKMKDNSYSPLILSMIIQASNNLKRRLLDNYTRGFFVTKGNERKFIQNEEDADNFIKSHPDWKKEYSYPGLANHCQFILTDFCNLGEISCPTKLDIFRTRIQNIPTNISYYIFIDNVKHLKELYSPNPEVLTECFDTIIFLGSKDLNTCQYISGMYQFREEQFLMKNKDHKTKNSIDTKDVYELDKQKCIILIKYLKPIIDYKYHLK